MQNLFMIYHMNEKEILYHSTFPISNLSQNTANVKNNISGVLFCFYCTSLNFTTNLCFPWFVQVIKVSSLLPFVL